jgi:hypothetical protein
MNCPGSISLINKLGDHAGRSGEEAARGTAAHTIAAMCLQENKEPWEYGGTHMEVDGWRFVVDQDMLDSVTAYVDFVWETATSKAPAAPGMFIERGMSSELHEDAYGTSDCIIYVPGDRIIIIDFKNGINIPVEPDDPQLSYYGYLAWENRPDYMKDDGEPKIVEMWIAQPRCMHPQGPFRSHTVTVKDLTYWFESAVLVAMNATKEDNATLKMGEWCRFCPARDNCPILKREALDYPLDNDPEALDEATIGLLLDKGEVLKNYIAKLQIVAFHRAQQGKKIPGRKLVRKISRRQWRDGAENYFIDRFGTDTYEPSKLKSPAQMEKWLEDDREADTAVEEWSTKPDQGLTLAARSDKRSEVTPLLEYDPMLFDEPIVADD